MKKNLWARLSVRGAAWALMTWCIAANAGAAPLRIMPLGDSITMGYGVGGGYRTQLYSNLLNAGYSFTFVGLNNENPSPALTAADQVLHNGYGGFRINHIMNGVVGDPDYLAADPDLVLLLIGTNDFSQNYDTLHAIDRLDALLTAITSRRPNAKVIVANLLIRWDTPIENRIQEQFNPFVPGLVATHASRGEKVFFLDLHSAISFYDILDGTHPSRSGYNKLGNVWFQAIQAALAAPTNNPPAGPVARVLTVNSVNPTNGVAITLSPNDTNNLGNGTTAFTRTYTNAAVLTLIAPALAGSNTFVKWQKDGVDLSTGATVNVTMDTNHTLTAHYASPVVVGGGGSGALVSLAFDEASGTTLVNAGSAGGTFTMTALAPSWTTLAPPAVGHGSALDFGYTQGNFALDGDGVLPALGGLSQFTITLWLNTRSPVQGQGGNRLVSWTDNGGAGVDLAYLGDGSLHLGVNREADFVARSSSVIPESFEVPVNNWRFCAVTYDAGIGKYVFYFGTPTADASLDKAVMYNQGPVGAAVGRLTVGHSNPATRSAQLKRVFRGLLDQVQIHGRVLSASEIVALQRGTGGGVITPPAGPLARVLTVNSVNPSNGVAITLSPNDTNNLGNGPTAFTRIYTNAVALTLTAPALAGSNTFVKWQKDGADLSTGATVNVTMDTNHTLTAHYASPVVVGGGGSGALVSLAFDEGSGATLVNAGSAGGMFTMTALAPSWTTLAPPAVGHGSALDFGYTQGNFALDGDAVLPALGGLSQFTITLWLNTRSPVQGQGGNRLVSWTDNGGAGVDLAYLGDGSLHVGVNREADFVARSSGVIPESFEVPANNWRFCAVTYDAGIREVRFYFGTPTADASLDKAVMYNQGPVGANVGRLTVGHSNPATRSSQLKRVFRGLLDQVQIHGRVLSPSEIVALQHGTGGGVVTPPAGSVARVLTVNSVNPTNGVAVTLSPNDTNNLGNGPTAFTRIYTNAAVLTLTAPALAGSNTFVKWQKDGVDLSTGATVNVTMDTNHTLTAHYASPVVVGGGGNGALVSLAFDEGSGAMLVNAGSAGGTFTMTAVSPSWTTLAPPTVGHGSALDFGYTQGNFALDSDGVLPALGGLSQFTITLWLNTRSPVQGQGGNRLVSWTDNGGAGVDLAYLGDGSLHVGVNREADFVARSSSVIPESFEVPVNNWRFCAVTYDAGIGEVRFYFGTPTVDASLDKAVMYNQGAVGTNVGRLTVGHSNPTTRPAQLKRVFRGLLDQVQIHGRVLSASEIVALQRGTSAGPSPAPPLAPANVATSLISVRLVGVTKLVDGRAQVIISGAPNRTYAILGSVDLQNWSVLSEQETDTNGALEFIDETAAETPVRFYRAVGM